MKTINKILLTIVIFYSANILGQSKVGTTVGQFLKIEPSSRLVAMGNAGTSLSEEASAAFYNYASAAFNIEGLGTFALQITSLNSGDIEIRTVEREKNSGLYYDVTNLSLGVAYGILLTDRVSAGVAVNYIQETIYNTRLSGFALNFGVQ